MTQTITGKKALFWFLRDRARFNKFIRTSEILKWGSDNFSNRALRNAQQFREDGKLRRLTKEESILGGFNTKEGVYEILIEA